ncbi:MAG: acriflavine resistance protein B [Planctomycetes bacterium]|nr:acriflavine resistance protein B [Planctomycetota bacterium]HJO26470.1 efflux RND transporter permease subunit [Planctomycetota bacterium]
MTPSPTSQRGPIAAILRFCLENRPVVFLLTILAVGWGLGVAPFDWNLGSLPRDPVAVDAIPDLGENQQIVFTKWMGRSPEDVEDQITYPLTVSLLGTPGVRTVRSFSFFGFSTIYVIFEEEMEFYESRSRLTEKLASLDARLLPANARPVLGPDATALGQVYWYTLEGRTPDGEPSGGWDLAELRSVQDWQVRYALLGAGDVSEVASIGGFTREYQVDVDPDAMRAQGVSLEAILRAVSASNVDVGARTMEINRVEYVIRGLGFIEELADLEDTVVRVADGVPIRVRDVASVSTGPAARRGALDKGGAEAVGGVVVSRFGANPLETIQRVKGVIAEISPGLPTHVVLDWDRVTRAEALAFARDNGFEAFHTDASGTPSARLKHADWVAHLRAHPRERWPAWANLSQLTIVPFYDRSELIGETLQTLETALTEEVLVTVLVVILMAAHLGSSLLVGALLPLAVLFCFIAMKVFGVDANIVALSGIAIAIGTMVDMGVVLSENILRSLREADPEAARGPVILEATIEVGSAVLTAVATTVLGFLPVFTMTGTEGRLFGPLAWTKTFALLSALVVALTILPPAMAMLFSHRAPGAHRNDRRTRRRQALSAFLLLAAALLLVLGHRLPGIALLALGLYLPLRTFFGNLHPGPLTKLVNGLVAGAVTVLLARHWAPLGIEAGTLVNLLFVAGLVGALLGFFALVQRSYAQVLNWCLAHKLLFLSLPSLLIVFALCIWLGFARTFAFLPGAAQDADGLRASALWTSLDEALPGLGQEFMPALDEGAFLYMPSTMPHASLGETQEVLAWQDRSIASIPEVDTVVGKLGRADTPLDPAPVSMIETVIGYKSEYRLDAAGAVALFAYDSKLLKFFRDDDGELIPDSQGRPFRQWREHIKTPDDIWAEILVAAEIPGTTSAPKLQPIETRLVMLQTGMRAPMGVKVSGPSLAAIEQVGLAIEGLLKEVPSIKTSAVFADRIVGKPYIEIDIERAAIARHGLTVQAVQNVIEVAIGGRAVTHTVEGRERYAVRVRYQRELRDDLDQLGRILVTTPGGAHIPLSSLAHMRYERGPMVIKSEDTFLLGYVLFDRLPDRAEVEVVHAAQAHLDAAVESGALVIPTGVSYSFTGTFEHQQRSQRTLLVVIPVALLAILLVLYLQFRSLGTASLVFSGIAVAWAGGFLALWLYGLPGFLDFEVGGTNLREVFSIHTIHLSVAVWVGFLALFGIASDDGVLIATYLDQTFAERRPTTVAAVRAATLAAGLRRVRPCLMTSATTLLALLPVLSSTGRGADVMVPMAIPTFGGMAVVVLSMYVVPVLYCAIQEGKLGRGS